jgi:hypothetical protein
MNLCDSVLRCLELPVNSALANQRSRYDCGEMQWLWCWRCKREMPMLDEREYAEIAALYRACAESVKSYRQATEASHKNTPLRESFAPMLNRYEALTGYKETNQNVILHHQLSLFGPRVTVAVGHYVHRRHNYVEVAWPRGRALREERDEENAWSFRWGHHCDYDSWPNDTARFVGLGWVQRP